MLGKKRSARTGANTAGHVVVRHVTPEGPYRHEDFLSDLKKVVKKLPPDHPSRSGSQKR